jgi:aspartyl-tRNA(Asn)/glutamyl-tRNA(Gln) amidotransferase subunit C
MTLQRTDVDHIALLSRLALQDEERERFQQQLDSILEHISRLQTIDTSAVAETAQGGELVNVWRDDVSAPSLGAEIALANAPARDGDYFVVGAIQDDVGE